MPIFFPSGDFRSKNDNSGGANSSANSSGSSSSSSFFPTAAGMGSGGSTSSGVVTAAAAAIAAVNVAAAEDTVINYAGLITVEESVLRFVTLMNNGSNALMWIGGIEWGLSLETTDPFGPYYAILHGLSWPVEEGRLWFEVSFVNSVRGGPIISCSKMNLTCIERSALNPGNPASASSIVIVKSPNGIRCNNGDEVAAYVRVFRECTWKTDHFTSPDTPHTLVMRVADTLFYVDKEHLMRFSPVFTTMLNGHFAETNQQVVVIGDVDPQLFNTFLLAIAPVNRVLPNPQTVVELIELAERFDVAQLREDCTRHLVVCPELPLLDRLALAHRYRMKEAKARLVTQLERKQLEVFCANL